MHGWLLKFDTLPRAFEWGLWWFYDAAVHDRKGAAMCPNIPNTDGSASEARSIKDTGEVQVVYNR